MPIDFPSPPTLGQQYTYAGITYTYTAQGVWSVIGLLGSVTAPLTPQGRLTLQSVTPVMTVTQAAKTTIYYTPYCGNQIPIWNGTSWATSSFNELSNATTASSVGSAGPAAVAANSVYDLFVWSNAGTPTLTRGPLWTNDTTRSAGTALVRQNGIWLNNATITNGPAASRGTYVGTTRSNASSQMDWIFGAKAVDGSPAFFMVWNAYNRMLVRTSVKDSTSTYVYNSTWRSANGTNNMRVTYVTGLDEHPYYAMYAGAGTASGAPIKIVSVGFDSTSVPQRVLSGGQFVDGGYFVIMSGDAFGSGIGLHFMQALEHMTSAGSVTWYGDDIWNGGSGLNFEGWM